MALGNVRKFDLVLTVRHHLRSPELARLPSKLAIPLGVVAAFGSGAAAMILLAPAINLVPLGVGEASISFIAAGSWMAAGLMVAQRRTAAGPIIFLPGAALAWFLARGVVHSVSPYIGIFSFTMACAGGGSVWWLLVRRSGTRYAQAMAIAAPILTAAFTVAATLATPTIGVSRRLWEPTSEGRRVSMVTVERDGQSLVYLWADPDQPLLPDPRDSTILLEADPGSGAAQYRVQQVHSRAEKQDVCRHLHATLGEFIEAELALGAIPPFVTLLPVRRARCERGSIWLAQTDVS